MEKLVKKVFKILGIAVLSIIGIVLVCLAVIVINSPGKLSPLKDAYGNEIVDSIARKQFIEIGGIQQGFFLRSENPENPVILFLHGGPGSPELPMLYPYEESERLEKYFTVCYWDQRGSGMTYNQSTDPSSMTLDQMIEDTRQMTEYLQKRFNQEKIFLMGHSWGSFLGIKTIEKYPENYSAYIGIGQISNQLESEKLAYDYMLDHAKKIDDKAAIKSLEKFDKNASDFPNLNYIAGVRSPLMNKYGIGIMHENFSMAGLVKDIFLFKGYTFKDKMNYLQGMGFSLIYLWDDLFKNDLTESSTSFQIPVFITHGKYDYQVSHQLSREYFEKIEASKKEFFTFENSAHSPNAEEAKLFVQTIRDIASQIEK
jgi:pimeloyl-ACP methyl ester carboxylesterase